MVAELWHRTLPVIVESLAAEMDAPTIITKIDCLRESLEVLGGGVNLLMLRLISLFSCRFSEKDVFLLSNCRAVWWFS